MKRQLISIVVFLILVSLVGCTSSSPAIDTVTPSDAPSTIPSPVVPVAAPPGQLAPVEAVLQNIYERVNQSVVNIRALQTTEGMFPQVPDVPGHPPIPPGQFRGALGSGFVWDRQGNIITNNHVIEGADRIVVTFYDGTTVTGRLVAADPDADLAVVKVDEFPEQLVPVQLADSTQLKVGQLSAAIGNPFGLEGTMTVGFVSALGRLMPVGPEEIQVPTYSITDVIQTDAPINPGNSGGVLVDSQGRVIGVTSAIISTTRANAGIGFAIPSSIVQKVVPKLLTVGRYEHPWLGISGISLNPDLAREMGLRPNQRGALIVSIAPGSPAEQAGLRGSDREAVIEGETVPVGGDVIIAIDGRPIRSLDDLITYLARSTEVGQVVTLTVLRQDRQENIRVTLAARPRVAAQEPQGGETGSGGATSLPSR